MLILWATHFRMPGEPAELLARAIALRLKVRGEPEARIEAVTGVGELPALEIAETAQQKGASLLIISTQGRQGLARLIHPSLTEALVRESPIPVLVMGPRCRRVRELGDSPVQLFRTEFSRGDDRRLRVLTEQSRALGFRMEIFHAIRRPIEPWLQTGSYLFSGAAPELHPYTSEELYHSQRHGRAWARWVEHQGVPCTFQIDDTPGSSNEHWIQRARELHAASLWLPRDFGRTLTPRSRFTEARELVRTAPCPVGFLP